MDFFDIDKVLDEFELNENDESDNHLQSKPSSATIPTRNPETRDCNVNDKNIVTKYDSGDSLSPSVSPILVSPASSPSTTLTGSTVVVQQNNRMISVQDRNPRQNVATVLDCLSAYVNAELSETTAASDDLKIVKSQIEGQIHEKHRLTDKKDLEFNESDKSSVIQTESPSLTAVNDIEQNIKTTIDPVSSSPLVNNQTLPPPASSQNLTQPIGFNSVMDEESEKELEDYLNNLEKEPDSLTNVIENSSNSLKNETETITIVDATKQTYSLPTKIAAALEPNCDNICSTTNLEYVEVQSVEQEEASPTNNESHLVARRPCSLDLPTIHSPLALLELATAALSKSQIQDLQINDEALKSSDIKEAIVDSSQIPSTSENSTISAVYPPEPPNQPEAQLQPQSFISEQPPTSSIASSPQLGAVAPYWVPDSAATFCMQCNLRFSLIRRRHHCRACGQVLCAACSSMRAPLPYKNNVLVRVCISCADDLLHSQPLNASITSSADDSNGTENNHLNSGDQRSQPDPNNPMEYCSIVPPHQQMASASVIASALPISVMVPVGVLKREGISRRSNRTAKNVCFSDGIRPGCDLTDLDDWATNSGVASNQNLLTTSLLSTNSMQNANPVASSTPLVSMKNAQRDNLILSNLGTTTRRSDSKQLRSHKMGMQGNGGSDSGSSSLTTNADKIRHNFDEKNGCYVPVEDNEMPPIYVASSKASAKTPASANLHLNTNYYAETVVNGSELIERLRNERLKFMIRKNFFCYVKIFHMSCCVNKTVINFTTEGLRHVGQDEIVILLEMTEDHKNHLPKDIFLHFNEIYLEADTGQTLIEMSYSPVIGQQFLGSREHGGFLYIRPTFQCLIGVHLPEPPYLIGLLIHRWEIPWAKMFPLRLMLRLGALYRYYPSPHVSVCGRDSVYAEIAQTIFNFLADFRTYSYTISSIRGMIIHMEGRQTTVSIPRNRYGQIMKALNNSSDHILALGANFSPTADGHLVCIQNTESGCRDLYSYSTQAINIQGKPRKITSATFFVLNGALKTTSGLSGKCNIVEDGLMVQILPAKMISVRDSLKNMRNIEIKCGPIDSDTENIELFIIEWTENDLEYNIGVLSPIDNKLMNGITSIRVHQGLDYSNANYIIRWTEVFIIQSDDVDNTQTNNAGSNLTIASMQNSITQSSSSSVTIDYNNSNTVTASLLTKEPVDISTISENIARSTSMALVSFLDLLVTSGLRKIALRATLDLDNVCYEAGSNGQKLAPLYMNALDNELIPILHNQITTLEIETAIIFELIFCILDK